MVFSYFTVLKHNVFQSYAWDLGIFNQSLYTTLYGGKLFYYTAELFFNPTGCYFAEHFSPILFLLLPVYAVNPSATTLLIIKSFILALGAFPLYFLAKELLKSNRAGFMLAIVYLLYPGLQAANWFDFQPQVFLPLLFFSSCYFMIKHRWKLYFPSVVLTLMVEEDVVYVVLVLAIYYFLITGNVKSLFKSIKPPRMNENLASVITLLVCTIYLPISIYVKNSFPVNPMFMAVYKALDAFSVLGVKGSPIFFPIYVLTNPQRGFEALMYDFPVKFLYIILLFGPLLFISFKSKLSIGIFALLSIFFFSNNRIYYTIGAHYPLYVLPLIFMAAIYGLRKLQLDAGISILKTMLIVTLLFIVSTSPISPISNAFIKQGLVWYPSVNLMAGENERSLDELIKLIPNNASVLTQNNIFPHVSSRINAYVIPISRFSNFGNDTEYIRFLINSSEYVLLDLSLQDSNTKFVFNEITQNNSYGAYALASNAILFKRGFQGEPLFAHFTEYRVFSAYKDLNTASFSQVISDPSARSEKVVLCPKGSTGYFMYGPYTYLLQGSYEVTFEVKLGEYDESQIGKCDISDDYGNSIVSKRDIFGFELQPNTWTNITLAFTSTKLMTGVEFRASSDGIADIYIDRVVMKRISPEAASDFGLRTLTSSDLFLISGYVSKEGFLVFPQNATNSGFWYGPYMFLPPGKYKATFLLKISPSPQKPDEHILTLSISANIGKNILAEYKLNGTDFLNNNKALDWQKFTLEFPAEDNLENVEFRGLTPSSNFDIYLAYIMVEKMS
jgi:uncharacterized membrane protein